MFGRESFPFGRNQGARVMKIVLTVSALCFVGVAVLGAIASTRGEHGAKLAHMVFFKLKDRSEESRDKFVASCLKYLSNHEGTVYFSVGTLTDETIEPAVNDRDYDVALHAVFESKEAEGKYLKNPRHLKFVDENKANFAKVRVFDSYIVEAGK
jgi:hypothetical protein